MNEGLTGSVLFSAGKPDECQLWCLDLSSQELKQLTEGRFYCDAPKWSPDGSQILFLSDKSGSPEVWVMNADGSDKHQVTTTGARRRHVAWFPNGQLAAYCAPVGKDGDLGIWVISVDKSSEPELLLKVPGIPSHISISSDGGSLLLSAPFKENYHIWEVALDVGGEQELTTGPQEDFDPCFSPDGDMIAYISTKDATGGINPRQYNIWTMHRDGTNPVPVSVHPGQDRHVAWSPDGRYLIYCASHPGSKRERLKILDLLHAKAKTLEFNRASIEKLLAENEGGIPDDPGLLGIIGLVPKALSKMLYDESFYGTERHPDWKG